MENPEPVYVNDTDEEGKSVFNPSDFVISENAFEMQPGYISGFKT